MTQSYDFVALTNDGQQQRGELRADSQEDAKVQVRAGSHCKCPNLKVPIEAHWGPTFRLAAMSPVRSG